MKLVILDRDGVINKDSVLSIKSPKEWIPIEGSLEAISLLNKNGYTVVVATNQSAIGKKIINNATLDGIHKKCKICSKRKMPRLIKFFIALILKKINAHAENQKLD